MSLPAADFQKTGRHKACPYRKAIPMAAVMDQKEIIKGGSFLIEDRTPAEVFTPEDFSEEHRMIAETTRQFMDAEVLPRIDELEAKDWNLARQLVKQAADLGLVGANIPEEYGGLGLIRRAARSSPRTWAGRLRLLRLWAHRAVSAWRRLSTSARMPQSKTICLASPPEN